MEREAEIPHKSPLLDTDGLIGRYISLLLVERNLRVHSVDTRQIFTEYFRHRDTRQLMVIVDCNKTLYT